MIKRIGIVGAGAVGSSLGSALYLKYGNDFCFVARGARAERLRNTGITVNGEKLRPDIYSAPDGRKLDLILLCVKNYSLEETIEDIRELIDEDTVILPLLNGVTAVGRVREAFPKNSVPYGIVMRTDAERIDKNITVSVRGEIQIGFGKDEAISADLDEIRRCFCDAGISTVIYQDMRYMLWRKWMINIGSNQVSVLTGAKFKYFGEFEEIIILVTDAIQEILDISKKMEIGLTEKDRDDIVQILINYPPEKKTSMLQDIEAKRRTEIDYFAGTVIELGKKTGIVTPVNRILYYAIKAKEKVGLAEKLGEERL
ncbi:MAG: ketopantoate reductase family protein [Clostridium sp.]|nr:ketopantoate reductase family protein [Clostridium sp.]